MPVLPISLPNFEQEAVNTDAEEPAATAHAATPALGALAATAMAVWMLIEEFASLVVEDDHAVCTTYTP